MIGLAGIRGQDRARDMLARALASGKLPHAYLFDGPAGVGKRTTALALAAALNCEREAGAPECDCPPCRKIAGGLHPDLLVLAPEGPGGFIKIEQIRELLAVLAFPPHEGRARVIVIEDAEKMNPAAANAFLKTLEEPPNRTHIVLLSSAPDRLLVTIRSRCQRIRFAPLPVEAVASILRASGIEAVAAQAAAALSDGSVARASHLAEGERIAVQWERARRVVAAARAPSLRPAIEAAAGLAEEKEEILPALELLAHFYKDAALAAAGREGGEWPLPGWPEEIAEELATEAARARGPALLARKAAAVLDTQAAILGFASAPVSLEAMVLTLREG
jgi:DNA polymerase III subunit delta'